jgi:hypothetical protein
MRNGLQVLISKSKCEKNGAKINKARRSGKKNTNEKETLEMLKCQ